jgi:RNA polymerase sigma-70 factor (ECF subfamily)
MLSPRSQPDDKLRTRASLLERLRSLDDRDSWQEFYDLYGQLVYRFAIQRGLTDAEAKDVMQETFVCMSRRLKEFKYNPAIGSFRSWLLHTTQWRVADQLKKRGPGHEAVETDDDSSRAGTLERLADQAFEHQADGWDRDWRHSLFDLAVDRVKKELGARQFQVFDLYVLKEWPVTKVAQTLGVNVGQVYLTKHRVMKMIRREIRDLQNQLI